MLRTVVGLTCLVFPLAAFAADPGSSPQQKKSSPSWTGVLDEEQFKALHQLKEGQAPPPEGTMIDLPGTDSRAYLSLPKDAKAPLPAVIVVHEWWGLNEHIKHWSDRLAADGYAALAVDLYGGKVAKTPDEAMALMKAVNDGAAAKILAAADKFLTDAPTVKAVKRGVIGWCFGGGWSLEAGLHHPDLKAVVMYYGHPVMDQAELKSLNAPLLGIFGNKDKSIPPSMVDEFQAALKKAGRKAEILRYDAPHAFANPSGPAYDEEAASAAWKHVRAFLKQYLK